MPSPALENPELVGRGFCADVQAWGEGRVLKRFHGGVDRDRAVREYETTRAISATGLPAPATYDLVEVEGRWGIVLARNAGVSLLGYTQDRPWALFGAIRQLAELHAQAHRGPVPAISS